MKYLVNRETKEHRLYTYGGYIRLVHVRGEWDVVEADEEGWVPWEGGDCPVPAATECLVRFNDGTKKVDCCPEGWYWGRDMDEAEIIAYRPILAEKEEWSGYVDADDDQQQVTAASILKSALGHMEDRAATYDSQGGERSMGKVVKIFSTLTGHELTDEQGWLFMICLKLVRSQQGGYRADSYEDGAAYFALGGESAANERGKGGSAAIKREAEQPAEDMSDWRNWREGDLVEAIETYKDSYIQGDTYKIRRVGGTIYTEFDAKGSAHNGWAPRFFRFHSRPAIELPRE